MGVELGERREGRLEFRGPSATSGYFENPAKTRELFHDGWLDTGDLGMVDAGGLVYLTGRAKDLIIRGGHNISAPAVEEEILGHPRVDMVAVVAMPDPRLQERACAFVIPKDGETVSGATPAVLAEHAAASRSKRK